MLLLLTGRERGPKPTRRPLQARGARASRYALHLTLLSSRPEASSAPHPDQVGSPPDPFLPLPGSAAPHRAGTAAEGASSPPGVGRKKTPPPPPSWNRARRLRQRRWQRWWPLPPAPAQRGFRLAREREVWSRWMREKPGASSGRQVSALLVVRDDLPQQSPPTQTLSSTSALSIPAPSFGGNVAVAAP